MAGHKRENPATTSGPMNESQEERPQKDKYRTRDRLRVKIHEYCLQQLEKIKNDLNLRFHGHAVDWLLPSDLKGLMELTQEMGYEMAGQTIDWLLTEGMETEGLLRQELGSQNDAQALNLSLQQEAGSLVELTSELGLNRGGETVDWLLEMATNPMLELMNLLGSKDGVSTIDWLLQQAQPCIAAVKNGFEPNPNLMFPSAMNIHNTSTFQPPANQSQFHNPDAQSHQQLQSTGHWFQEKQGWDQFQSSASRHQGESPIFNGNEGSSSLSNGVKRRRKETGCGNHVGKQLESQCPSRHRGSQETSHIERATANPAEGITQNAINGVDGGSAGGFQGGSTYLEEMPLEVHMQNNSGITGNSFQQNESSQGNSFQQNESSQFPDPKALLDYYFATYNFFDDMPYPSPDQFGNNDDQIQNQFVNTNEEK